MKASDQPWMRIGSKQPLRATTSTVSGSRQFPANGDRFTILRPTNKSAKLRAVTVNGNFVAPTIFDDCTSDMRIIQEKIFGPVVTVQTFETEQEAVDLANETRYGLAGGLVSTLIHL